MGSFYVKRCRSPLPVFACKNIKLCPADTASVASNIIIIEKSDARNSVIKVRPPCARRAVAGARELGLRRSDVCSPGEAGEAGESGSIKKANDDGASLLTYALSLAGRAAVWVSFSQANQHVDYFIEIMISSLENFNDDYGLTSGRAFLLLSALESVFRKHGERPPRTRVRLVFLSPSLLIALLHQPLTTPLPAVTMLPPAIAHRRSSGPTFPFDSDICFAPLLFIAPLSFYERAKTSTDGHLMSINAFSSFAALVVADLMRSILSFIAFCASHESNLPTSLGPFFLAGICFRLDLDFQRFVISFSHHIFRVNIIQRSPVMVIAYYFTFLGASVRWKTPAAKWNRIRWRRRCRINEISPRLSRFEGNSFVGFCCSDDIRSLFGHGVPKCMVGLGAERT